METAICTKCGRVLPADQFYPRKRSCKDCGRAASRVAMRKRRQEFPELIREQKRQAYRNRPAEHKEQSRKSYLAHREKRLAYAAQYREQNRDRLRNWLREYRAAHPEKQRESDRKFRQRNRERIVARDSEYRKANRVVIRLRNRSRRVSLRYSVGQFNQIDWEHCLAYWHNACAICGAIAGDNLIIAADHWIPLRKGGRTDRANIVPLCHGVNGCNNHKNSHMPLDWLVNEYGTEIGNAKADAVAAYFASLAP